jgi:hypothetical protein
VQWRNRSVGRAICLRSSMRPLIIYDVIVTGHHKCPDFHDELECACVKDRMLYVIVVVVVGKNVNGSV